MTIKIVMVLAFWYMVGGGVVVGGVVDGILICPVLDSINTREKIFSNPV